MDIGMDHYSVLGVVWEGGRSLSEKEIEKAYRLKAREVHPDKRRNDPEAHSDFIRLQSSYALLKDEESRRAYESQLKLKRKREDEEKKETPNRVIGRRIGIGIGIVRRKEEERRLRQAREEEERWRKQLMDDIERIKGEMAARAGRRAAGLHIPPPSDYALRLLIVSNVHGYTSSQLTELFQRYGEVKSLKIRKKKGSAVVLMATQAGASAVRSNPPLPGLSTILP